MYNTKRKQGIIIFLVRIRIAHSPDSDDAFMFYPLTAGVIDTEGLEIEHVLADIETLNQRAWKEHMRFLQFLFMHTHT
jgi:predicted solute-binding protein